MSEASFETVLSQLREAAPAAPESLRERVLVLRPVQSRIRSWLRPSLAAAIILAVVISVVAALASGPHNERQDESSVGRARTLRAFKPQTDQAPGATAVPELTAKSRLQKQDVAMRLRVGDLSGATQSTVRTTRRLGGFVAG